MPYSIHYPLADDVISHMLPSVSAIPNSFLKSRYAGFAAVSAATVYELAIKTMLLRFAQTRDIVFYNYLSSSFERLNVQR